MFHNPGRYPEREKRADNMGRKSLCITLDVKITVDSLVWIITIALTKWWVE